MDRSKSLDFSSTFWLNWYLKVLGKEAWTMTSPSMKVNPIRLEADEA